MHRIRWAIVAIATLSAAACSNKELIRQKDLTIADLRADSTRLENNLRDERKMNDELRTQLSSLENEKRVLVEERDGLTHITLDGSATFGIAQAWLTPEGKDTLDQIWGVVQNYPDRWILIEGHADNRPIRSTYRHVFASNWALSSARAHSVLHYLVGKHGADQGRLAAVGYGEQHPVADNATSEGRAQNRRVVITIGSKMEVQERMEKNLISQSEVE